MTTQNATASPVPLPLTCGPAGARLFSTVPIAG